MSAKTWRWTAENISVLRDSLGRHRSLLQGLIEASQRLGFEVSRPAADYVLGRHGYGTCYSNLNKGVPDVLERDTCEMLAAPPAEPDWGPDAPAHRGQVESAPDDETPAEKNARELEWHRLRSKLSDLESAKTRLLRELHDREEQILILKELRSEGPLPPIEERPTVGALQRQGVAVLVCSDWHVEEPVDPEKVNGLNEYSLDIADACIDRLVDAFEWLLRDARYDVRTAIVALLGDLLSGYIHAELEESNFLSPTQAILWLSVRLERFLRAIAARCPQLDRIIVPCLDGNHGRNTHKIRVSTRSANSLEWLLYHTLAAKMADDPRFEFRIADGEWLFVDVYHDVIAFTHGDSFQYGGGVGGMSIPIRRGISRQFQGKKIAKYCMGHFHQQQDFGDILINGSMIGYSPYAMRIHAPFETRKQSWFLWDSRKGQALSAPVWL